MSENFIKVYCGSVGQQLRGSVIQTEEKKEKIANEVENENL